MLSRFDIKNPVTEKEATRRANICEVCPNLKKGEVLASLKDSNENIVGHYCGICKCPSVAMIRSKDSECKADKW